MNQTVTQADESYRLTQVVGKQWMEEEEAKGKSRCYDPRQRPKAYCCSRPRRERCTYRYIEPDFETSWSEIAESSKAGQWQAQPYFTYYQLRWDTTDCYLNPT